MTPLPPAEELSKYTETVMAAGRGWQVADVLCRCGPGDPPAEERHSHVSVAAVLSGSFSYRSDKGRAFLAPGSFLLGNVEQCYCCGHAHDTGDRCVAFQCGPEFVEEIAADLPGIKRIAFTTHRLAAHPFLVPTLARIARFTRVGHEEDAEALAVDTVSLALRACHDTDEAPLRAQDESRVAAAIDRINHAPDAGISLSDLAADAQIGRHHFLRVFRRVTGVTPYAYLMSRRLMAAADALFDDDARILDIALDAGFSDLSDFTRRFRAAFGMPPARYRAQRTRRKMH